eukprot:GHRQ01028244.1.p1 GENE.GHRQ01028244.1~~GHRQ01028244.1.p1  ORF type:complete len:166 (-),score=18.26 GHRQ01028244.1:184-681(-)
MPASPTSFMYMLNSTSLPAFPCSSRASGSAAAGLRLLLPMSSSFSGASRLCQKAAQQGMVGYSSFVCNVAKLHMLRRMQEQRMQAMMCSASAVLHNSCHMLAHVHRMKLHRFAKSYIGKTMLAAASMFAINGCRLATPAYTSPQDHSPAERWPALPPLRLPARCP